MRPSDAGRAMRVRRIDVADPRWEEFLVAQPRALVYQHPAWLRVLERTYGYQTFALACESSSGELRGILPLARRRGLLTGRQLSSLPHTPLAGPLARDPAAAAELVEAAIRSANAERARLQLKSDVPGLETAIEGLAGVKWATSYVLDLPAKTDEELRFGNSRNHRRIRWAVGKASREGVRVREADKTEDVRAWYRLYIETMRIHAVPPHPFTFFLAAWEELRPHGLMRLLLAEHRPDAAQGSKLLAGTILFMAGTTVFYAFSGLRRDDANLHANDLLLWHAIHQAQAEGFRHYDLGAGLRHDTGLASFKRKWGGNESPRYRYHSPVTPGRSRGFGRRADVYRERGGPMRSLAERTWRHLPLPATTALGAWFYRNL